MNTYRNRFIFSALVTIIQAFCFHPSRGPQGYEMIRFDYPSWVIFTVITFLSFFFYISPKFFKKMDKEESFICPSCEHLEPDLDKPKAHNCPKCGEEMVKLEGFYDGRGK